MAEKDMGEKMNNAYNKDIKRSMDNRIIILDEDIRLADIFGLDLKMRGYSTKAFDKGKDFINFYLKNPGNIVAVADMDIPRNKGINAILSIKEIAEYNGKNVETIGTTTYLTDLEKPRCINKLLVKPFYLEKLFEAVKESHERMKYPHYNVNKMLEELSKPINKSYRI